MRTSIVNDLIRRRRGDESFKSALLTSCPTAFTLIELLAGTPRRGVTARVERAEPKAAPEVLWRRWTRRGQRGALSLPETAFTLIELLVVMATIALLAVTVLPALARTEAQSKTAACTARFRQWAASANLYANDNRGWLPSFNPAGGASFAWDVGTGMPNALYPYGMDVPVWFCPMRPTALEVANQWGQTYLGHPIQNTSELTRYWSRPYPEECVLEGCCNYWVPRQNSPVPSLTAPWFPTDYSQTKFPPNWITSGNPTCLRFGWPQRLHDRAAPYVPFVSDTAGSGQGAGLDSPHPASPTVTNISPTTAHFVNGVLIGVNLSFADGHVTSHTPDQMRAVYYNGQNYWFY